MPEPPPVTKAISPFKDFGHVTKARIDSKTEIERNPANLRVSSGINKPMRTKLTISFVQASVKHITYGPEHEVSYHCCGVVETVLLEIENHPL